MNFFVAFISQFCQVSTKDIIEVEGEAERLKEENKNLWKQLVDTQLEVEAQLRELRQLRETVAHNKAQSNVSVFIMRDKALFDQQSHHKIKYFP